MYFKGLVWRRRRRRRRRRGGAISPGIHVILLFS